MNIAGLNDYTYAKRTHWEHLKTNEEGLYGSHLDIDDVDLKRYQDLVVFSFILEHVPPGSRLLEIGGGNSRILSKLSSRYECWNIDKFEGLGNGPTDLLRMPYKVVRDYMGMFNKELPNNYFDFVFSISALEHVPTTNTAFFHNIIQDIDRVLAPGGVSAHCLDVVFKDGKIRANPFIFHIFYNRKTLNESCNPDTIWNDPATYYLSQSAYDRIWKKITKLSYSDFGFPTSINVFWMKFSWDVSECANKP